MSDDFLDDLGDELRAAYNPPPATPRERLWRSVQAVRAAREVYNPPPPTPREELWHALRARRGDGPGPAPWPRRAPARRWLGWALPIAATLLVGISIGRFAPFDDAGEPSRGPGVAAPETPPPAGAFDVPAVSSPEAAPTADAGVVDAGPGTQAGRRPPVAAAASDAASDAARLVGAPAAGPGDLESDRAVLRGDRAPARDADRSPTPRAAARPRGGTGLYRVAALETLGGAEALLGVVGAGEGGGPSADAAAIADWSEDMLSETRLLMDSPAAEDPAMRALLEDLELVLAQLVRLGEGTSAEGDLALIEGALRERQLLYRIRALLPAGPITSGT